MPEVLALIVAAAVAPLISATSGVAAARLGGVVPAGDVGQAWVAWWVGDALGALIVTPLLLTWAPARWPTALPRPAETAACLLAMLATGAVVFNGAVNLPPLAYFMFPFVVWSALRLGQAVVSASVVIAAALAISGTLAGVGQFGAPSILHGLLTVQLFMAVVAATALTVGAVIAERRAAETALEVARTELSLVTATMSALVTRCSRELRYLWVSRPYAAWLGRAPGEIVGRRIDDVIGTEALASIRPHIEQVLSGERVEYEDAIPFHGIGRRWIHAVYVPTRTAAGAVDGWVAVVADVTDSKQLEERLRDEGRRKDEFLAMLAHELRNPLAPIRNAVELLRLLGPAEPRLVRAREMIDRQVEHLVRLVDDLLDVSRVTQGKINLVTVPVDLADVLGEAIDGARPLLERHGHVLTVSLAGQPIQVHGDRTRLVQVFTNLLQNAAKFTPPRGSVTVTSEYGSHEAVVRVRDTGIGLTVEARHRIFELFVQEAPRIDRTLGGLGIGLTLVQRLVELHGGRVEAQSDGPGTGCEFIVTLPASVPAVSAGRPRHEQPVAASRPLRIFLVEDNLDAAESFVTLLELGGHQVRSASDGLSALEVEPDFTPDVAFIDLGLPGLDGYEVARRLRQRPTWRGTVLIALSGYGREEDRRLSHEAGFDHHLVKPVDPRHIDQLLAELTARSTAPAESAPHDLH
jgi:PAS domain S-box-containing protein